MLYSLLAYVVMTSMFFCKSARSTPNSKWVYMWSSVFDVVALNTSVRAFTMTLIASVTMLTVLSIVMTTLLSIIWLKIRYFWWHYVAMLICAAGVFLAVYSDFFEDGHFKFGTFWGDILAIISALCYGVTSVFSDYLLRNGSNNIAVMAHLGLFGGLFSLIAFFAFQ